MTRSSAEAEEKKKTNVDEEIGVIKIDKADGQTKAYIVNFAAHPTSLGSKNRQISADYPGYMAEYLEEDGVIAIFTNGALADVTAKSPSPCKDKFEKAKNVGEGLAEKVLEISKKIETKEEVRLNAVTAAFDLPPVKLYKKFNIFGFLVKNYLPSDAILQLIEINDALIIGAPCDLGSEAGLEIKNKSSYKHTFVVSQANDYFGYVMLERRYEEGGYEPKMHFHGPKVAEILINKASEMINYLKN